MIGKIHRFFVGGTTTTRTVEQRPMTDEEIAAFDAAFGKMNAAFDELSKVFERKRP
jgi:hypothetical protein